MIFKTHAVLTNRPNFGTVSVGWMDNTSVEQTGFGVDTIWKLEPYMRRKGTLPLIFFSRDEIMAFEAFIDALSGRLKTFWVPTWTCDLIPNESITAGDTTIDIEDSGIANNFNEHPGFKFICLLSRSSLECLEVTSAVITSSGERLHLKTAVQATPDNPTAIISWLLYARLADDSVELQYETDDFAECGLKVIELPAELATAGIEGRPVFLYKFTSLAGNNFWTSYIDTITYGGQTYAPSDINHGTMDRSADFVDEGLALEVNTNDPTHPLRQWMQAAPMTPSTVTVYEHLLDTGATTEIYTADVLSVVVQDKGRIQVTLSTLFRLGNSKVPRLTIGLSCNWQLFSAACGLAPASFEVSGSAVYRDTDSALLASVFSTQANGYFAGGRVKVGVNERSIVGHIGNVVWLNAPLPVSPGGVAFQAWPGCDNQFSTCKRFNNSARFGGAPYWPMKNPQLAALNTPPGNQGTKKG